MTDPTVRTLALGDVLGLPDGPAAIEAATT